MDGGTGLVGVCVGEGAGGQLGGGLQGAPVRQGGGRGGEGGLVQQAVVQGHTETRFDSPCRKIKALLICERSFIIWPSLIFRKKVFHSLRRRNYG
jgi:hypothetical protein